MDKPVEISDIRIITVSGRIASGSTTLAKHLAKQLSWKHVEGAKTEVIEREANDLEKWRKLYANNEESWVYWDKKYYDLVVNTFTHNQEETLKIVLEKLGLQ